MPSSHILIMESSLAKLSLSCTVNGLQPTRAVVPCLASWASWIAPRTIRSTLWTMPLRRRGGGREARPMPISGGDVAWQPLWPAMLQPAVSECTVVQHTSLWQARAAAWFQGGLYMPRLTCRQCGCRGWVQLDACMLRSQSERE